MPISERIAAGLDDILASSRDDVEYTHLLACLADEIVKRQVNWAGAGLMSENLVCKALALYPERARACAATTEVLADGGWLLDPEYCYDFSGRDPEGLSDA